MHSSEPRKLKLIKTAWGLTGAGNRFAANAFTTSPERARRSVSELKSGIVGFSSFPLAASGAPFGDTTFSGLGREGGTEDIGVYLNTKVAQIVF